MNNSVKFICIFSPLTYTRPDFLRKHNLQSNIHITLSAIIDNNYDYVLKKNF